MYFILSTSPCGWRGFHISWTGDVRGIAVWLPWRKKWNPLIYYFWRNYGEGWKYEPRDDWDLRYNDNMCIGCGRYVPDGGECHCDVESVETASQGKKV